MHVAFVYGAYENLGIQYLSSCLKRAGHRVSLVYNPLLFRDATLDLPVLARWMSQDARLVDFESLFPSAKSSPTVQPPDSSATPDNIKTVKSGTVEFFLKGYDYRLILAGAK